MKAEQAGQVGRGSKGAGPDRLGIRFDVGPAPRKFMAPTDRTEFKG